MLTTLSRFKEMMRRQYDYPVIYLEPTPYLNIKLHSCDPDKCKLKAPEVCKDCEYKGG